MCVCVFARLSIALYEWLCVHAYTCIFDFIYVCVCVYQTDSLINLSLCVLAQLNQVGPGNRLLELI